MAAIPETPVGGKIELPIVTAPDFKVVAPSNMAAASNMAGSIDLILLGHRPIIKGQRLTVLGNGPEGMTLGETEHEIELTIVELAAVRVDLAKAVDMARVLIEQVKAMRFDPAILAAEMAKVGLQPTPEKKRARR